MKMPRREKSCHRKLSARLARSALTNLALRLYGGQGWASLESAMAPGLKALLANTLHLQLLHKQRQILYFGVHWQAGAWSFNWLHQERAKGELLRFSLTVLSQMAFGRESWGSHRSFIFCLSKCALISCSNDKEQKHTSREELGCSQLTY